jgi:peptidoglycan/LPS O-acetylase OafA/YrhL
MKIAKVLLTFLFAVSLGVICVFVGDRLSDEKLIDSPYFHWYALAGFSLGLLAGIFILKRLSQRSLGAVSIGLGSLAFVAMAVLFYLYWNK